MFVTRIIDRPSEANHQMTVVDIKHCVGMHNKLRLISSNSSLTTLEIYTKWVPPLQHAICFPQELKNAP
uniref:Uncharacterized protein n=1 Tax=Octopus bimaculoides TaxID=37653 RepID=A0A0L8G555_OCTBM